jgi:thiamine biosynthesis lipoprotein
MRVTDRVIPDSRRPEPIRHTTSLNLTVMGVQASITMVGGPAGLLDRAASRLVHLETLWSRFLPGSDITRLNNGGGGITAVSPETLRLIEWMVSAHSVTDGLFDPSMLQTTLALGDAASRRDSTARTIIGTGVETRHGRFSPEIHHDLCAVALPDGVTVDPGGIGKGLAADIVATESMELGADGVCVNLGGDLRCTGDSGHPDGWLVDIMSGPSHDIHRWRISLRDGGVATSSTLARRWMSPAGRPVHHLIDPATGAPATEWPEDLQLVSVVAERAAWSEAFTKAVLLGGWRHGSQLADQHGLAVAAVTNGGRELTNEPWRRFQQ